MERILLLKRIKVNLFLNLALGLALLIAGIIVELLGAQILDNSRILVALSFIPLALVIVSWLKIREIKKYPDKSTEETDERLVTVRDNADAVSLRIVRYIVCLGFLAYTFARSAEVFESFTWWLITGIAFTLTFLPTVLITSTNKKSHSENA